MASNNGTSNPANVIPPNTAVQNLRGSASDHVGGIYVAMADGHVLWVSNSVNTLVYYNAFTRAGGETTSIESTRVPSTTPAPAGVVVLFCRETPLIMAARYHWLWLAGALLFAGAGCGGSDLVNASGRLTYKGQPVPSTYVTFAPQEEGKRASVGLTDSDGNFK